MLTVQSAAGAEVPTPYAISLELAALPKPVNACAHVRQAFAIKNAAGAEVPMPYATSLELAALPQIEDIIKTTKKTMNK
jgi:pyruvate/2-oxoglutarate/acetoin dehydrogenase E1 component